MEQSKQQPKGKKEEIDKEAMAAAKKAHDSAKGNNKIVRK